MLSVCLCVIGLSFWAAAEHVTVTPEYKKLFVDTHNKIRREVGSSNMQYLEWDDKLAAEAADWAGRCRYNHKNGQGENLAFNTNKMTDVELIKDAMNMWYEEKNDYNYNSLSCRKVCSHYTNLVWAITTKFGCGMEKCCNGLGFYTVCFYRPVGNWVGQYPYLTGDACSRCNPGQRCDKQLCRGVSTKNISTGIGPRGDGTVTTSTSTTRKELSKDCADNPTYSSRCLGWKFSCKSNRGFMETNCPKTCGVCSKGTVTTPTKCMDSPKYKTRCPGWRWSCNSNKGFMHMNCRKSCGLCR